MAKPLHEVKRKDTFSTTLQQQLIGNHLQNFPLAAPIPDYGERCSPGFFSRSTLGRSPDREVSAQGETAMKRKLLVAVITVLSLATLGLTQNAAQNAAQDRDQPSAKSQERITKDVRHQLLMLPYLGVFDNIAFKVDGYTVILVGQVARPSLKPDAENVVKRIEGVEKVDNQIEVLPTSPSDDRLRHRLYNAIYKYAPLQKYALGVQKPIRIIVKNGNVTLEGVVDNEGDKNFAGMRANGVSGIFSVTNNLRVESSK
jgi:hyperosmotically inducible periplasmic protein